MTPLLVSVMYILSEPVGPGNKQLWFRRKIMQTVFVFFCLLSGSVCQSVQEPLQGFFSV